MKAVISTLALSRTDAAHHGDFYAVDEVILCLAID
jgi:hypothetical protein